MVAFGEVPAHELRPDAEHRQGAAQGSRFRPLAVVRELGRGLDDAMGIAIAKPAQPPFDFEIVIVDGRVVARGRPFTLRGSLMRWGWGSNIA
jgi:hypothetical protein